MPEHYDGVLVAIARSLEELVHADGWTVAFKRRNLAEFSFEHELFSLHIIIQNEHASDLKEYLEAYILESTEYGLSKSAPPYVFHPKALSCLRNTAMAHDWSADTFLQVANYLAEAGFISNDELIWLSEHVAITLDLTPGGA